MDYFSKEDLSCFISTMGIKVNCDHLKPDTVSAKAFSNFQQHQKLSSGIMNVDFKSLVNFFDKGKGSATCTQDMQICFIIDSRDIYSLVSLPVALH